jgi:hypothetical protein
MGAHTGNFMLICRALRVNNVPRDVFEELVESDSPPTIDERRGKGEVSDLKGPDLPVDTAVFCAAQAEAIRVLGRRVVRDVIEIGQRLSEVHNRLAQRGHGRWTQWLHDEFGWSDNAARRYMDIAGAWGELVSDKISETNVFIDISALHLLSHEAVPPEIRAEAIDKAEAGERITLAEAKELIAGAVADKIAELRAEAQNHSYDRQGRRYASILPVRH